MAMTDMKRVSDLQETRIQRRRQQKKLKKQLPATATRIILARSKEEWDSLVKKAKKNRWGDL